MSRVADKLRKAILEADGLPESTNFKYGWLRQNILLIADNVEFSDKKPRQKTGGAVNKIPNLNSIRIGG